ncbi:MAG: hypothetical protein AB7H90_01600 [Alphaproteobacteria bacterium]
MSFSNGFAAPAAGPAREAAHYDETGVRQHRPRDVPVPAGPGLPRRKPGSAPRTDPARRLLSVGLRATAILDPEPQVNFSVEAATKPSHTNMPSVHGVVHAVQEGRFRLAAEDGRVLSFILSHKAGVEPQDLAPLAATGARVRIDYSDSPHVIASVAHRIEIEE